MKFSSYPEAVVAMITDGFTTAKAFRHHAGHPIQCVASVTGIDVARLVIIESGSSASDDEMTTIGKALELPHGVLGGSA